jgi:hypothetical protein
MNLLNKPNLNIRMCHNFVSTSIQMMRTTILIVIFFLGITNANAQIERGKFLFGLSGSYLNNFNYSGSALQISPKAGYFLANRFALGTSLNFYHSVYGSASNTSTSYGFGPIARYYFLPSVKFNLFVQPIFLYNKSIEVIGGTGIYSGKRTSLYNRYGMAIAPVYFVNQYIAIELLAQYLKRTNDPGSFVSR